MGEKKTKKRKIAPRPAESSSVPRGPLANLAGSSASERSSGEDFWSRDNIENLLIAVVLALLFRAFLAEAFVIPTGSMAPTLMGRHKDLRCEECGSRFQVGDTEDPIPEGWSVSDQQRFRNQTRIAQVICPTCRFPTDTRTGKRRFVPYNGDRILVNKFAYQWAEPQRWDVIVFKFPGNAKQNYIKRLVGLPREKLRITHGDVFVGPSFDRLTIARKPLHKLPEILHVVHDTNHLSPRLIAAGWPSAWFAQTPATDAVPVWEVGSRQNVFHLNGVSKAGEASETSWLRYRHVMPTERDWEQIRTEREGDYASRRGSLISDFYGYNSWYRPGYPVFPSGWNWVGDLAIEADLQLRTAQGELVFDLVEAGRHHTCSIDVRTGQATLQIDQGRISLDPLGAAEPPRQVVGQTRIRAPGRYQIRFSNVDNQLGLWVNEELISWRAGGQEHSGHYTPRGDERPRWSESDPGDLYPAGIGGRGAIRLSVHRLRILRDIYYIAVKSGRAGREEYSQPVDFGTVQRVFSEPQSWETTPLFESRGAVEFQLGEDQFFPMGDNSPFSLDARLWSSPRQSLAYRHNIQVGPWVPRDLLIGKAFFVYWPHGWDLGPIPLRLWPQWERMKRIF